MKPIYEPFIIRRLAEGRILWINAAMPFEYFLDCFQVEQPFCLISQLEDGRICITPNPMLMPLNMLHAGYGPRDLLPTEYEYITLKDCNFPVMITAHPVKDAPAWFSRFERFVNAFVKQTLAQFVAGSVERIPVRFETQPKKKVLETAELASAGI